MFSDIEEAFKSLINCLQSLKMYGEKHPMFLKTLDQAGTVFDNVLSSRGQIVIGIVGEELAFEKDILFDLGNFLHPSIIYLKERNIERIAFSSGLTKEELAIFINFLSRPKEEFKEDPQSQLQQLGAVHVNVGKLKASDSQAGFSSLRLADIYESSAEKISQALNGVLNLEKIDHAGLKFSLSQITENLSTRSQELLKLATLKRYDVETYVHMLNVSILAMFFSSRLGFAKADVLNIGMAAMFHDIGKIYISRKILHKPGKLSEQEFGRITSHTVLGGEIMLNYVDTLGILPVVVSFEHHLKHDKSGYPRMPLLKKQHIASSIVAICDVYDALSQRRGYKQDYSPDVVYNIMDKEKGTSFDPELLEKFFTFMGFWPVGSIVELNDLSIGRVIDENDSDIRRPKLEILKPADKKRVVDLTQENNLKIEKYLNPWKEGKDFLSA